MPSFRMVCCAIVLSVSAWSQTGTPPKKSAAEYPVHVKAGEIELGAEYMVHSYSSQNRMFVAQNHLVVEIALYPPKGKPLNVSAGFFRLRLNGQKEVLYPQAPELVVGSLRNFDRGGTMSIQNPDGRVITTPPPAIEEEGKIAPITAEEACTGSALPEGHFLIPVSGYLYFPYRGKTKKIKSAEILYNPDNAETVLPLL